MANVHRAQSVLARRLISETQNCQDIVPRLLPHPPLIAESPRRSPILHPRSPFLLLAALAPLIHLLPMSYPTDNPFDDGQQWQSVPSSTAWTNSNSNDNTSATPQESSSHHLDHDHGSESHMPLAIPLATPTAPATPHVQPTAPSLAAHAPAVSGVGAEAASASSSSRAAAAAAAAVPAAPSPAIFEDAPPSYEATFIRDIPQIHDNYDHLRGPPGQRGVDVKIRIPSDSTPASHYQSGGSGSGSGSRGGNGAGSSSRPTGPSSPHDPHTDSTSYGAIPQQQQLRTSFGGSHMAQPSAPRLLQGQVSQGREDDELHSRDVDQLLGAEANGDQYQHQDHHTHSDAYNDEPEEPETHWGVVGDGKAWMALTYILVVLLPWSLFCFVWTLVTAIVAAVSMIVPPIGYFFVVATVTTWRALARVDLVLSRSLVAWNVREKYPYRTAQVFVSPSAIAPGTQGGARRQQRIRRRRNLWHRGVAHLKATVGNKHTFAAMFYFLLWKLMFALFVFVFVIVLTAVAVPLMILLLPTLLIVSRKFIDWQFRWAVFWLTEKMQPIALP